MGTGPYCTKIAGFFVIVNDGPAICSSNMQSAVEKSATEVDFAALPSCVREVKWLGHLLDDLGVSTLLPMIIFQDNI